MSRFLSVVFLLLVLSLTGCESPAKKWAREEQNEAYQFGKAAHVLGVPATANPYGGNHCSTGRSRSWFQGWMDAEKERREGLKEEE